MVGPSRQCQVCNEAQSKYKCPSCLIPYCSLGCFKTHKETPCAKPESTNEKSAEVVLHSVVRDLPNVGSINNAVTTSVKPESTGDEVSQVTPSVKPEISEGRASATPGFQVERKLEVNDPSEVLQVMQMQAIASSDEVREALKDEHLQKLITDIDSSPDALNELDKAMGVDVLRIFSDKIPVTYAGGVTVMDDLETIKAAGNGRVDVTVGSALDIFGGNLAYSDVVAWHESNRKGILTKLLELPDPPFLRELP